MCKSFDKLKYALLTFVICLNGITILVASLKRSKG
jgi:hypothetical protein